MVEERRQMYEAARAAEAAQEESRWGATRPQMPLPMRLQLLAGNGRNGSFHVGTACSRFPGWQLLLGPALILLNACVRRPQLPPCCTPHVAPTPCRRAEEARQAAIVEEERRKLLAQAADLQGFLPRGVLRDKADAELLRTLGRGGVGSGAGAAGPGVQAAGTQGWR